MAIHDWTRVSAGTFHDFHARWITHLAEALNAGLLPAGYYALAEQPAAEVWPDVLALEASGLYQPSVDVAEWPSSAAVAVAQRPPKVSYQTTSEAELTAARQRTLVVRHASGDRIVALLEVLSPGNKDRKIALDRFVDKVVSALRQNYHLLIVDLLPPGRHDPEGIHGAIWAAVDGTARTPFRLPPDRRLTLAAYEAKPAPTAYVEPIRVGDPLPDMPLFIEPGWYIHVPLEATYATTWGGVPERWRQVIEGAGVFGES
jgi:hypothetical protein